MIDVEDLRQAIKRSSDDITFGVASSLKIQTDRIIEHLTRIEKELINLTEHLTAAK